MKLNKYQKQIIERLEEQLLYTKQTIKELINERKLLQDGISKNSDNVILPIGNVNVNVCKDDFDKFLEKTINSIAFSEKKMFRLSKDIGCIKRDEYVSNDTKTDLVTYYDRLMNDGTLKTNDSINHLQNLINECILL